MLAETTGALPISPFNIVPYLGSLPQEWNEARRAVSCFVTAHNRDFGSEGLKELNQKLEQQHNYHLSEAIVYRPEDHYGVTLLFYIAFQRCDFLLHVLLMQHSHEIQAMFRQTLLQAIAFEHYFKNARKRDGHYVLKLLLKHAWQNRMFYKIENSLETVVPPNKFLPAHIAIFLESEILVHYLFGQCFENVNVVMGVCSFNAESLSSSVAQHVATAQHFQPTPMHEDRRTLMFTPFHMAVCVGALDLACVLVSDYKAQVKQCDGVGQNWIQLAKACGNEWFVTALPYKIKIHEESADSLGLRLAQALAQHQSPPYSICNLL